VTAETATGSPVCKPADDAFHTPRRSRNPALCVPTETVEQHEAVRAYLMGKGLLYVGELMAFQKEIEG
jgi:hypothetical protein